MYVYNNVQKQRANCFREELKITLLPDHTNSHRKFLMRRRGVLQLTM